MNQTSESSLNPNFIGSTLQSVSVSYDPTYVTVFEFEKYDYEKWREWMAQHRYWSIYASVIYVITVFVGQWLMRNRAPFQLRKFLTIWNASLALFSTAGFLRSAPEMLYVVSQPNGFHRSVCILEHHNVATSLWSLLFVLSKVVEFGDTAFIILRKQPLIFLHWYHHASVSCVAWFAFDSFDQSLRWFSTINYFVHSLMYTYYVMKSLRITMPKKLPVALTCLQLSQMVVGVIINVYTYFIQLYGGDCRRPYSNIYLILGLYASYFILFANFFRRAYLQKKKIQ